MIEFFSVLLAFNVGMILTLISFGDHGQKTKHSLQLLSVGTPLVVMACFIEMINPSGALYEFWINRVIVLIVILPIAALHLSISARDQRAANLFLAATLVCMIIFGIIVTG